MKTLSQISSGLHLAARCLKSFWNLKSKELSNKSVTRILILCIVFFIVTFEVPGGKPWMTEEMRLQSERAFFYYQIRYLPFSEDLLKKCLDYEGVKYQDIAILQSRLETGNYSSDIFMNGNNLFGMKYPSLRPTVAVGIYREHAKYAHWSDSVIDYALWQEWYLSLGYRIGGGDDNDFYLVFLKCIPYAEDPRYVPKLVKLSQRDMT